MNGYGGTVLEGVDPEPIESVCQCQEGSEDKSFVVRPLFPVHTGENMSGRSIPVTSCCLGKAIVYAYQSFSPLMPKATGFVAFQTKP